MMKKILLIIGIISLLVLSGCTGKNDALAEHLTKEGVLMYGAFWCSACNQQKAILGKSFKKINYVECSTPDGKAQTPTCIQEGITSYPTWQFADGTKVTGVFTTQQLAEKSGFKG
ncbi:hypothetical protein HOD05_01810 [Candidatus Woesearchaeota archaeon]|mgnify:CR=1|jgi:hypothetical protein|nr:hypothetical protein [Candidatus Woesearchaeota archaeon]MBT4433931.1 hypothetical protein [Candidatus Woesearchaeota archaeon]